MESPRVTAPADCQLFGLYDDTSALRVTDKMRHFMLRLLSAVERRIKRLRAILGQPDREGISTDIGLKAQVAGNRARTRVARTGGPFVPGEVVEVLSYEEIKATLDEGGACDRLSFMEGMKRYCGTQRVVKKKVTTMFDERAKRMVRMRRSTYILEGAVCDGVNTFAMEGCDRCCYFFWTDRWLRRLS